MTAEASVRRGPKLQWTLVGLALVGCCALCGVGGIWLSRENDREEMDKARHNIAELKSQLVKTYQSVPELTALSLGTCPDPDIKLHYGAEVSQGLQGEAMLWVSAVPYDLLGQWIQDRLRPGAPSDWMWMAGSSFRHVLDPSLFDLPRPGENIQSEVRSLRRERYLVVFRAASKAMPRVTGEGARLDPFGRIRKLEKGKSFAAGSFHGWLVVMDMATGSSVCQAPLEVESPEALTHRSYGYMTQDPREVVSDDFKERFRKASREALGRISTLLSI